MPFSDLAEIQKEKDQKKNKINKFIFGWDGLRGRSGRGKGLDKFG